MIRNILPSLAICIAFLITSCGSQKNVKPFGTDSKKAFILFGEALKQHDYLEDDKALELLEKALSIDPKYVDALDLQGNIYLSRERFELAEESFLKILAQKPDHIYALIDLSKAQFNLDKYDQSLRNLNRVLPLVGRSDKREEVLLMIESAEFAKYSFNNAVPFEPKNMGEKVNSKYEDYFPGLSTNENQFYFTRRDGSLNIYEQNEDIFSSVKVSGEWQAAKNIGEPVNTEENEGAFSASPDGRFLLFTSCSRAGGVGRCDIWQTEKIGDTWTEPTNLGMPVNTVEWESQPSLASDGVTLYFVSNRPGGFGGTDIWYSIRRPQGWSQPKNLGPEINTPGDEEFPFIHHDGKTLYFTSEGLPGMGKSDIYMTRNIGGVWQKPKNLGYPINTHGDEWNFIVNRTGDKAYFASNGIEDGFGGMDIYEIDLYEEARPTPTGYVEGHVFDIETKRRIKANVDLYDLSTGEKIASTSSDPKNGEFLISLPANANYALEARAEGYLFHSENFEMTAASLTKPQILNIGLKPIKTDISWVMKNVLFDVNKSTLKQQSFVELKLLVEFMEENKSLSIEIGGHTDNTGSESLNKSLSENRAKAVYDYLISNGIESSRLSFKGYGSSKPIDTNDTDEGKANNRRTEVKIVK
jgi:outer membrane protein OmpA-like peptidoglycan-associated protein